MDVGASGNCLTSSDWRSQAPVSTTMATSARRASAVFDRYNVTIMDVLDLSEPTIVELEPADYFLFYEIIFALNQNQPNWGSSIQYMFLTSVASSLQTKANESIATGGDDRLLRLQEFLAVPIALYNNAVYGGPTEDMGKSMSLAIPGYMVRPQTRY